MLGVIASTKLGKALMLVAGVWTIRRAFDRGEQFPEAAVWQPEEPDFTDTQPAAHALSSDDWAHTAAGIEAREARLR